MSVPPADGLALIKRIEASTLEQLIGWGMDRYEQVFTTLGEERSAIEDSHRHVLRDGTMEDPDPLLLKRELARVNAAEAKIVAAITAGSRGG